MKILHPPSKASAISSTIKSGLALALAFLLSTAAAPAHAWNGFGHMVVAYIAYKNLSPARQQRVIELLKLNPYYWPDAIKNDNANYQSDGPNGGNTPGSGPESSQNLGYSDHLMHKYWHYIDIPFTHDRSSLPKTPSPNIQTQITAFRTTLASTDASDELKSYDLTWLLHFLGDIHQPLHCVARISKAEPDGDDGGNKVLLNCEGCGSNLHSFWDGALGRGKSDTVAKLADKFPSAKSKQSKQLDPAIWVTESVKLAKKRLYISPINKTNGPFKLSSSYQRKARTLAQQQAQLAGERLANILNNELK